MKKLLIVIAITAILITSCTIDGQDGIDGENGLSEGVEINTQIECCTFPSWLIGSWVPLIGGDGYTFSDGAITAPYNSPTGKIISPDDYAYSHEEISTHHYYLKLNLDDQYLTGWSITVYKSDEWIIINDLFYVPE